MKSQLRACNHAPLSLLHCWREREMHRRSEEEHSSDAVVYICTYLSQTLFVETTDYHSKDNTLAVLLVSEAESPPAHLHGKTKFYNICITKQTKQTRLITVNVSLFTLFLHYSCMCDISYENHWPD